MTRSLATLLTAALCASAAFAPSAGAKITELGVTTATNQPTCPKSPCLAVSRTTGYQVKIGPARNLFTIPRDGRIVAWSISLGKPGPKQTAFFEKNLGGPASAGIAVLRPGAKLYGRLTQLGPVQPLKIWFGKTVQFGLPRSLVVHRGEVLALNVPTWAPALAVGLGNDSSWRASRADKRCGDTSTQSALGLNGLGRFVCQYRTARLTYAATMVSTP